MLAHTLNNKNKKNGNTLSKSIKEIYGKTEFKDKKKKRKKGRSF